MSAIASILIGVAAKVGAPIVKDILQKQVGGIAGEIGGTVIDAIAGKAGVPVEQLPDVPEAVLEQAVKAVEHETPELLMAHLEQQRETNRLQLAEMQAESKFGWMWRPAGMWLMIACIAWLMFARPLLNALLWSFGSTVQVEVGIDIGTFMGIFTVYTGLYMGGHTALKVFSKK